MSESTEAAPPSPSKDDKDEKRTKPLSAIAHRMFHPPKLERKHSSGDLHSRLKTRKILGVGETDNGDIHRSKISQLLGHNEHLYIKFPRGYWLWHLTMASMFTFLGVNNLFFPNNSYELPPLDDRNAAREQADLASRYYGCTCLALAFLLWSFWGSMDKAVIRSLLLAVALCHSLQFLAYVTSSWGEAMHWRSLCLQLYKLAMVAPNAYFYRSIGFCGIRMRKSTSFNNLRDCCAPFTNNSHGKKTD